MELIGHLVAARASQLAGDWERAHDDLATLIGQLSSPDAAAGSQEVLWEARWELALTLGHLGEQEARLDVLRDLLAAPMTEHAPLIQARVLVETARALRQLGRLSESVSHAEQAVRITGELGVAPTDHMEALVVVVSAYAESGDWQRADALCEELMAGTGGSVPPHVDASALWAAGGMRRLAGRPSEALDLLNRADALAGSGTDLSDRARLVRARALAALAAGEQDSGLTLVEQLRALTELLGSPSARTLQSALECLAALRRGETEQADRLAPDIMPDAPGLTLLDQAWSGIVRARAHRGAGRSAEAEADYRWAADRYEQLGSYRLAMETWRELHADGTDEPAADLHGLVMP
ncbi:transcriptional regulator [Streptomyces europaeiscabiei]|uniref:Transcriptional regulator n=1 Tax=Streptomyces europaeiscabiei TaxID=146819 RepID=A0AAJ2PJS7_9ACTN|nr:transcriptional regulator [Streptomyces europaeiscabiei]MDX3128468.1 transcriptional regulator [Streptomyces europaeiscabiei]